jgi:hypothetical protein
MAIKSTGTAASRSVETGRGLQGLRAATAQRRATLLNAAAVEPGTPGTGNAWRWLFSGVWLIYLISPVIDLFHHGGALWIAGGLVIVVAFCVIYMPLLMYHDDRPGLAKAGLVTLAVLAGLACVIYGSGWTPMWIYVSAAAGMVLVSVASRQVAFLGILVITVCYLFFC